MTTPSVPSLADAITAAKNAGSAYSKAVSQTQNDQAAADSAQQKADAAKAVVTDDQQAQDKAAGSFVTALQDLVSSAQAQIAGLQPPAGS
jgi:hypothetical protein